MTIHSPIIALILFCVFNSLSLVGVIFEVAREAFSYYDSLVCVASTCERPSADFESRCVYGSGAKHQAAP